MSVTIELSFNTDISREVLLDLRDHLRKEIPGIDFNLNEPAMQQGRMGIPWAEMFIHATVVSSSEVLLLSLFEPAADNVKEGIAYLVDKIKAVRDQHKNVKNLHRLDISGSAKVGDKRTSFKITDNQSVQYFNESAYSIDPEHTYVLLVGCGNYADRNLINIPAVEQNLKSLRELMLDKQYFAIPPENLAVSLDDTDAVIKRLLHQYSRRKGIETFLFYYVGHGFCTGSDKYYLSASNTEKENDFINGAIDKEFIKEYILSQSPAKQKIAIVDACYSGLLTQGDIGMFDREVTGSYILTSSSADEVSFYDKEEPYTFFTGALVSTVKNGLRNDSETLSLDDLYTQTGEEMKNKKLQKPTYKNGLNIAPANFVVAHNAAYSEESEIVKLNVLTAAGRYKEAELKVQKLIQKFPGNEVLKKMALQISNDRMYSELVHEGDNYFYAQQQDYRKAAECYQQAYELKKDIAVRDKLLKCKAAYLKEHTVVNEPQKTESLKSKSQPVEQQTQPALIEQENPLEKPGSSKKWGKRIVQLLAIFFALAIAYWVEHRGGESEEVPKSDTAVTFKPVFTPPIGTSKPVQQDLTVTGTTNDQFIAKHLVAHRWRFSRNWDYGIGNSIISFEPYGTVTIDDENKFWNPKWRIESGILYMIFADTVSGYTISYNSNSILLRNPDNIIGVGSSSLNRDKCTWEMTKQ